MRILRKWLADDIAVLDLTAVAEAEVIMKVRTGVRLSCCKDLVIGSRTSLRQLGQSHETLNCGI